jgi:hypothetical protein
MVEMVIVRLVEVLLVEVMVIAVAILVVAIIVNVSSPRSCPRNGRTRIRACKGGRH